MAQQPAVSLWETRILTGSAQEVAQQLDLLTATHAHAVKSESATADGNVYMRLVVKEKAK